MNLPCEVTQQLLFWKHSTFSDSTNIKLKAEWVGLEKFLVILANNDLCLERGHSSSNALWHMTAPCAHLVKNPTDTVSITAMDLGGIQCRWHLLLLIIELYSVVCSTFVVTLDCTASNEIQNVQLVTTKHTSNKCHNFNPGIASCFSCSGEQDGPARLVGRKWGSAMPPSSSTDPKSSVPVVPVGRGVYSKPVVPWICTSWTQGPAAFAQETQRSSYLFFYYSQSLTRGIWHHSTSINADLVSSPKPTNWTKKTFHCVAWTMLKKALEERESFFKSSPFLPDSTVSFSESMSSFSCFFWQSQNPEQNLHEKETNKLELFVSNLLLVLFSLPIKILYLLHQEISADKSIHLPLA